MAIPLGRPVINDHPRVLIIDDDPDQVEMYEYALEAAGFGVSSALLGRDGITKATDTPPDLIVLDLRLPDMAGWDVCASLKQNPNTASIPVVLLTAAASPSLADEATKAGCTAHLLKPCYPDELARTIRSILAAS